MKKYLERVTVLIYIAVTVPFLAVVYLLLFINFVIVKTLSFLLPANVVSFKEFNDDLKECIGF